MHHVRVRHPLQGEEEQVVVTRAKCKPADDLKGRCWVLEHSGLLFSGLLSEVLAG